MTQAMTNNSRAAGNGTSPAAGVLAQGMRVANARYLLKRLLGRGPCAEVWLARDRTLEHDVALKFLPAEVLKDAVLLEGFKREVHRSLQLTHPAIARTYAFVQSTEHAAVVMEYIDGWSLAALKVDRHQKRYLPEEILPWLRQLCSALDYAHLELGLWHQALRPANLLLNARDQFKVTDFGIAHALRSLLPSRGNPSAIPLACFSPQRAQGAEPTLLDDIYALGATIYDLLTGTPPFYQGDVLAQIRDQLPPTMNERLAELGIDDAIPRVWEEAVAICLAKVPAARPQSAAEVLELLERARPG
jgi:serine/threonine protein kinase